MIRTSYIIYLLTLLMLPVFSQNVAEVQGAVESGLVSPAEAMEMARDHGYSDSEIQQKAREFGYDGTEQADLLHAQETDMDVDEEENDNEMQAEKPPRELSGEKLFGYDFFNYPKVTFEPMQNMPAPADYMIGPGDEILIIVWGETQLYHELPVRPNGSIVIPNVGMVSVNGLTLENLKETLLNRMTRYYASLRYGKSNARSFLDVSLGKLKTIRVYVLGEVNKPGGYALNSLATVFTALYYSGGPSAKGSLRNITVKRGSETMAHMDLYDYLVDGDNSRDIRLENGDIVMVSPAGKTVTLKGRVFRPARYELTGDETFSDLLRYAGGFVHDAYLDRIHLERVIPFEQREQYQNDVILIDFAAADAEQTVLEDGDVITVAPVNGMYENFVSVEGAVKKPGVYALTEDMTVAGLIKKAGGLLGEAYPVKGELVRTQPDMTRKMLAFNVGKALQGDAAHDLVLSNLDMVRIHSLTSFRDRAFVFIDGAVRIPGTYDLPDSMSVVDLILLAGGFKDNVAPNKKIEVYRIDSTAVDRYSKAYEVSVPVRLADLEQSGIFYLQRLDRVFVRENPAYEMQKTVQVEGEVMYTGVYAIETNKVRISDIIKKAGGVKPDAFVDGFKFERQDQVVFVDLKDVLKRPGKSKYDIYLRDLDYMYIPKNPHMIKVAGQVMTPAQVLYRAGKGIDYYIEQAGGFTDKADKKRMQVRLANGKMWKARCLWLDPPLTPGTEVLVPEKIEKDSKFWENAKDIVGILSSLTTMMYLIYNVSK